MTGTHAKFPDVVFLRRPDETGYGFFYYNENDFRHAVESFSHPILRSFAGDPVPGQPKPQDHLKTAIATFIGQAFDKAIPAEVGAEGVSRAVAACVRTTFGDNIPRAVMIERRDGKTMVRPAVEYLRHPGYPMAIIVDADAHGGDAHFFPTEERYRAAGESAAGPRCWLPQIIYRLYQRTPSVMAGRPKKDASGKHSVECRGVTFGLKAPLEDRQA